MTKRHYIQISPRGFANETYIRWGSKAEIAEASDRINNDPNAWAQPVPASHKEVRAAQSYAKQWGDELIHVSA